MVRENIGPVEKSHLSAGLGASTEDNVFLTDRDNNGQNCGYINVVMNRN